MILAALAIPLVLLAASKAVSAQETAADTAVRLEPVQVSAPRLERDWLGSPAAIGLLEPEDVGMGRQGLQLDEYLNRIPGLQMQNRYNFAQDIRLSIRGFGARAPFGVRGLHIRVDGIPETLPDGQSQVDAIDLESLHRAEVIRGPSSTQYGNAAGGVVDLHTQRGRDLQGVQAKVDAGSHGLRRLGIKAGDRAGPWEYSISGWDLRYDGYRDHSRVEKRLLNAKLGYEFDDGAELQTVLRVLDAPDTQDPGALTRDEVREDRRQAREASLLRDGGQSAEQQTLGITYTRPLGADDELELRGFVSQRDFHNRLPFKGGGQVRYQRDHQGLGARYARETAAGGIPVLYAVGMDLAEQRDDRQRFDNLEGGIRGAQQFDQLERARSLGIFTQASLELTDRLNLVLGGRHDRLRMSVDDRFSDPGEDRSGRRDFREWSYRAGLGYAWAPGHQLYAQLGTSFESPTFTEFANPDGGTGLNPDLEPERARSLELGAKGFWGDTGRYELAVFTMQVRDEIVNYQSDSERDYYENSGRSRRHGLEAGASWHPVEPLRLTLAYTLSHYRFREFRDESGEDFSGKAFPGVPRQQLFAELDWQGPEGRFVTVDMLAVDRLYADNANTERVSGHVLTNLRLGRAWETGNTRVVPYLSVNNLFDQDYQSNIRINALGGRYYEPGPGREYGVGLSVQWR
ncbi:TonB-dependent receptor family protein [Ectothiorhodospira haloalkaliphila]|nr:TonB-dependent receptor [Ectothiorhodospira haloalkaliphila]